MIVQYRGFPKPSGGVVHRPIIQVKIKLKFKSFATWALLDSGADRILINKQIGKQLEVDFNSCEKGSTQGIYGESQTTWDTMIELIIAGFEKNIFQAEVSFIESQNVGILLGHNGFFEFFDVKLQTAQKQFDIELAK